MYVEVKKIKTPDGPIYPYVKIQKIKLSDNFIYPAPDITNYNFGKINTGVSVPIGYEVTGYLLKNIEIDQPIVVDRDSRNGLKISGRFQTSKVECIKLYKGHLLVHTNNSIYIVEQI